jgi:16S rRNA (guanine527-N7)-methyltransferase
VNPREELQRGCAQLGISLGADEQNRLLGYLALLRKWNKVYNLTAIREEQQMVSHHLLDSLAVIPHLWAGNWLDVGCGAGLPGIIMAIMRPSWQVTLLDSNSKKTSFVQQAIIELGLQNAQVYCARVEIWKPAEKFDGIISRAFSELGVFLRNSRHLIAQNGRWVAMKGVPNHELEGVAGQCRVEQVIPLQVPGLNAARSLVIASCEESNAT